MKQDCYCNSFDDEYRKKNKIPDGYCGLCDICGKPGHTQHFPGSVPYTGTWCDRCLQIVARNHKIKSAIFLLIILSIIIGLIWVIIKIIL